MATISKNIREQERIAVIKTFKHFAPGARVDVQFNSETPFRVKGKLIGFDEGKYVIFAISANMVRDYPDIIRDGNGCVVRTLVEGEAGQCVAFRSNIQYVPIRPKGLIFINFPERVESISLRKETRMSTKIPVTIIHRDDDNPDAMLDAKTELNGSIIDVSSGGCRINVEWRQGQAKIQEVPVYLKVNLPGRENSFIVKADIKNQTREDPTTVSLGLMFIADDGLKALLSELNL